MAVADAASWCSSAAPRCRLLDLRRSLFCSGACSGRLRRMGDYNGRWALESSAARLRAADKPHVDEMEKPFEEGDEALVRGLFFSEPYVRAAWPINAFRLSERLRIQRGAFLIPGDTSKSFMANLRALPGYDSPRHIVKIVIPKELRLKALDRLFSMGISRSSLFPGLQ